MAEGTPTTEVRTRLTAETADFQRGMERASKATQAFTAQASRLQSVLNTTAVVTAGVTTALVAFGFKAFNAAARVDELDIAINAVGKSTGLGYQAIQDTALAIKGMGIEMEVAQKSALKFAQNNLKLEYASQLARAAQDLAVISGQNSTDTYNMLTHAVITGRSEVLKTVGIQKSAGQMYATYAASIGKTTKQLTYQEKQQAVATGALAEAAKVAGTYEAAMTTPGKVLRSFSRLQNEIMVSMGGALLKGFGPTIYSAYEMTKSISKATEKSEKFQNIIKAVGLVLARIASPFKKLFDKVKTYIDTMLYAETATNAFGERVKPAVTTVENLATKIDFLLPPLAGLAAGLGALGGAAVTKSIPGLGFLSNVLKPLPFAILGVVLTSTQMRAAFGRLFTALKPLVEPLKNVAKILSGAMAVAVAAVAKVISGLATGIEKITNFFRENERVARIVIAVLGVLTATYIAYRVALLAQIAVSKIALWWTNAQAAAQQRLNAIMAMNPIYKVIILLVGLVTAIVIAYRANEDFAEVVRNVFNFVARTVGTVIGFFLRALGNLMIAFGSLMDTNTAFGHIVANVFQFVFHTVLTVVKWILQAYKYFIDGFIRLMETSITFRDTIQDVFNAIIRIIALIITAIVAQFANLLKGIATIIYGFGKMREWIVGVWQNVSGAISRFVGTIVGYFSELSDSIGRVITDIRTRVSDWIGSLAKAAAKLPDRLGGSALSGFFTQLQVDIRGASDSVKTLNENASRATLDKLARDAADTADNMDFLSSMAKGVIEFSKSWGNYKGGVAGAISQVANLMLDLNEKVVQFTSKDLGKKIADGLLTGAKVISPILGTLIDGINKIDQIKVGDFITNTLGTVATKAGEGMLDVAKGIENFVQGDVFTKVADGMAKAIEKLKETLGFGDVLAEERKKAEEALKKGGNAEDAAAEMAAQADAMKSIREAMKNGIDGIRNVIQDLRDASIEFAKSLKETIVSFAGLKSIELPDGFIPKAQSLIENMRMRLDKSVKFASQIESLQGLGLNTQSLRDIIEMGPVKGAQIAASILGVGNFAEQSAIVKQMNELNRAIAITGATIGEYGASAVFNQPIADATQTLAAIEAANLGVRNATAGSSNVVVSQGAVQIVVDASNTKTAEEMSEVVVREIERVFGTLAKELAAR